MRVADMLVQDTWPGTLNSNDAPRLYPVHGFEVKVSRADWLAELRQPDKANTFAVHTDFWWLVVSDKAIVHPGELPRGWGLLTPRGATLAAIVKAPLRSAPLPMPAGMRAAFLRSALRTAAHHTHAQAA